MQLTSESILKKLLPDNRWWSLTYWIAGGTVGAYSAFEAASRFSNPQFRWFATSLISIVFWRLYWIGVSAQSRVIGTDGKQIELPLNSTVLFVPAISFTAFLLCDIAFVTSGQIQLAIIDPPQFHRGQYVLGSSGRTQQETYDKTILQFDDISGVASNLNDVEWLHENYTEPRFSFWISKNPTSKELIVEDIQIVVHRWEQWSSPFRVEVQTSSIHTDHVDRIIIPIKKLDEPLPWTFSASHVFADSHSSKPLRWEGHRIVFRNEFARLLEVVPVAQESGLIEFTSQIVLRNNLSRSRVEELFLRPRRLVAIGTGRKATSKLRSPAIQGLQRIPSIIDIDAPSP